MAPFPDRPLNKLCLFDVDETLTPARQVNKSLYLGRATLTSSLGGIAGDDLHLARSPQKGCCGICRGFRFFQNL